jgi:uncharacterized protein YoxC
MRDEEINRKFEVVADHMATFAVGMQDLKGEVRKLAETQARTDASVRALLAAVEIQAEEIRIQAEEIRLQAQEIKELGKSVQSVDGRQRDTDDRLNALINTVERYISERRNGRE